MELNKMDDLEENRKSLKNALHRGNFDKAKEKINDNIGLMTSNIKELQTYLFKIGSSSENKISIENDARMEIARKADR